MNKIFPSPERSSWALKRLEINEFYFIRRWRKGQKRHKDTILQDAFPRNSADFESVNSIWPSEWRLDFQLEIKLQFASVVAAFDFRNVVKANVERLCWETYALRFELTFFSNIEIFRSNNVWLRSQRRTKLLPKGVTTYSTVKNNGYCWETEF